MANKTAFDDRTARELSRQLWNMQHEIRTLKQHISRISGGLQPFPRGVDYCVLVNLGASTSPALSPGGEADAYYAVWDSDTEAWEADTTRDTFKVYDRNKMAFGLDGDVVPFLTHGLAGERQVFAQHKLILKCKPDSNITAGSSGTVSVWSGGSDSGVNLTAHVDWMDGGDDVSSGKEAMIKYFPDEDKWYVIGAECE